jgi:hypothetical protein
MKTFTIENETNSITLHASPEAAQAISDSERFTTAEEFASLAAAWQTSRLVEIWNGIPGVTPVKKFKDRATATTRIWTAIKSLRGDVTSEPAEETQTSGSETEPEVIPDEVADEAAAAPKPALAPGSPGSRPRRSRPPIPPATKRKPPRAKRPPTSHARAARPSRRSLRARNPFPTASPREAHLGGASAEASTVIGFSARTTPIAADTSVRQGDEWSAPAQVVFR